MHIFISYAHQDIESVVHIVELLRKANHDPWFDERLVAGQQWKTILSEQIAQCDTFVIMVTKAWLNSQWCQWELYQAVQVNKPIVPILLETVEISQPLSHLQYVDFTKGANVASVAKLFGGLTEIARTIPVNNLPSITEPPIGVPSRAETIEPQIYGTSGGLVVGATSGDVFIGNQTNAERVVNAASYVETQTIDNAPQAWTPPIILGLMLVLLIVAALVIQLLPEPNRGNLLFSVGMISASMTPTTTLTSTPLPSVTPTNTPERMPANQFNVVVAGFAFGADTDEVSSAQIADDMSDIVYDSVRELPQIDNIRGWRANGVGRILGKEPRDRESQAAIIAELLNADVVIYGVVSSDGIFNILQPEFYVSARFASVEPELVGSDSFGRPIEFVGQSDDQLTAATDLQRRLRVLRLFLRGLALYIQGDFANSRKSFEDATDVESDGLEVLYVFAGNSALREPNVSEAFTSYNEALRLRPTFARALIGRGIASYNLALSRSSESLPRYRPELRLEPALSCSDVDVELPNEPQLLAELAVRCYEEAELSTDKPATADIDVKVAFGIGQVRLWQSQVGYGRHWDEVESELQTVLDLYAASDMERQTRIRASTAHANAWLGLRLISIDGTSATSVTQALNYYRTAISLLRADINRNYNQTWIDLYTRQAEALNTWLSENTDAPSLEDTSST